MDIYQASTLTCLDGTFVTTISGYGVWIKELWKPEVVVDATGNGCEAS